MTTASRNTLPRTVPEALKRPWPDIRAEDKAAVLAVLDRGTLGGVGAPESTALEREWAEFVGRRHALLFNSGTATIHAALYAIGLRPGDEVITTAFTFSGTYQPILQQLGVPVFVDINPRTYTLDTQQVEAKITERTRVIIPVHIHGMPCDMDEVLSIATRYGLAVVEDACQAHGATYHGRQVGTFGALGCYSLNSTKILCGAEGGLLVADDDELIAKASRIRTFGEDIPELKALTGWTFRPYTVNSIGWNYRHQEMPAALARAQLTRLPEYIATGQGNAAFLTERLSKLKGMIPPYLPDDRSSTWYMYRVRIDTGALGVNAPLPTVRDSLGRALQGAGVDCMLWHTEPAPLYPVFQEHRGYGGSFPWSVPPAGRWIEYHEEEFPRTRQLLDSSLVVGSSQHPIFVQPRELMEHYVDVIEYLLEDPDRWMAS
jgi:perosamine synthetase